MKRREFLQNVGLAGGAFVFGAAVGSAKAATAGNKAAHGGLRWKRSADSRLFTDVICDSRSLVASRGPGVLDVRCRLWTEPNESTVQLGSQRSRSQHGPLRVELHHALKKSGGGLYGDDVLEASLVLQNTSDRAQQVEVVFTSSVQPAGGASDLKVYVPLSAAGLNRDKRLAELGSAEFLQDCRQEVGGGSFVCHYLEPMGAYPNERETRSLLLAPVIDAFTSATGWRVAFFTPSEQPMKFRTFVNESRVRVWEIGRVVTVQPGEVLTQKCWLLIHRGDAAAAWKAFHRFAHQEDHPLLDWPHRFRVHYYDFLSSAQGADGRRGDGYEADLPHFKAFHVGLATQHGYYPSLGDYIQPDRKTWLAMRGDKHGPAAMSFEKMRDRLRATRAVGAKAAVYMHPVLFDDATPFFEEFRDCVLVDRQGQLVPFPWRGPDTVGRNWRASMASSRWRDHLLQQAEWIMDILRPDAICIDETFAGLGYDYHPDRSGPMSAAMIEWVRQMRKLVRSYGEDKAIFVSDCSMSPFVLWADGEVGDHAYPPLLGNRLYRQEPVRYLAALGEKAWRPCAWHFRRMWNLQLALARQVGAGVGVSNGWLEYTGLHGLPQSERRRLIADIESLEQADSGKGGTGESS